MSAQANPFRSTGAIRDGEAFVDREREMRRILEALAKGQSVQVYGPRRRGKTSLLFAVQRALAEQGRQSLYLTLELFPTATAFWRALVQEVSLAAWDPEAPDYLALGEALVEKGMVLLLDELDRAIADPEGYPDDFFVALRGLEIGHGVPFVVAAKGPLGQYERFHGGPTSPFGNTFLPLPLPPFDEEAAQALLSPLTERAQAAGWPEDWVRQVHRAAQGEPWKLQRFGERLWEVEPLPPWAEALSLWREALREGGEATRAARAAPGEAATTATEAPSSEESRPTGERAGGLPRNGGASRPWYLSGTTLALVLLLASSLGLSAMFWPNPWLGGGSFLAYVLLLVLAYKSVMWEG